MVSQVGEVGGDARGSVVVEVDHEDGVEDDLWRVAPSWLGTVSRLAQAWSI